MSVVNILENRRFYLSYTDLNDKTVKQFFPKIKVDIDDVTFYSFSNSTASLLVNNDVDAYKQDTIRVYDDSQ